MAAIPDTLSTKMRGTGCISYYPGVGSAHSARLSAAAAAAAAATELNRSPVPSTQ